MKKEDTKSWCRNGITMYYEAYDKQTQVGPEQIILYKNAIKDCITKGFKYPLLKKEIDTLSYAPPIKLPTGQQLRYGLYDNKPMKENFDKHLKNLIRENLLEVSSQKKKNFLQEKKIVKNRFKFLTEGNNLKSTKGQKKLGEQLFLESIYLKNQGFDQTILNEGFWDVITGFFGRQGGDIVMGVFKENAVKWLIEKCGVDPNGWIASVIITAVGNLNVADIPKLTDCDFVTKLLSKSLAEGVVRKIQAETVGTGWISEIGRAHV